MSLVPPLGAGGLLRGPWADGGAPGAVRAVLGAQDARLAADRAAGDRVVARAAAGSVAGAGLAGVAAVASARHRGGRRAAAHVAEAHRHAGPAGLAAAEVALAWRAADRVRGVAAALVGSGAAQVGVVADRVAVRARFAAGAVVLALRALRAALLRAADRQIGRAAGPGVAGG